MNSCHSLQEKFLLKPSVYLSTHDDYYSLYVSVTVPAFKTLKKVIEKLETDKSAIGVVGYAVEDDPEGCKESWEFQELFTVLVSGVGNMDDSKAMVKVESQNGGGTVIVHYADADEEGPTL